MQVNFFKDLGEEIEPVLSIEIDKENVSFNPLKISELMKLFKNISQIGVILRHKP